MSAGTGKEQRRLQDRYQYYLADTVEDRAVGTKGTRLAELTPEGGSTFCECVGKEYSFEDRLRYISMGIVQPSNSEISETIATRVRTTTGEEQQMALAALARENEKDMQFIGTASASFEDPRTGFSPGEKEGIREMIQSARARVHERESLISSMSGDPLARSLSRDRIRDLARS